MFNRFSSASTSWCGRSNSILQSLGFCGLLPVLMQNRRWKSPKKTRSATEKTAKVAEFYAVLWGKQNLVVGWHERKVLLPETC